MKNNFLTRLLNLNEPKNAILDLSSIEPGWHPVGGYLNHYNDDYENGYSSIRAIANRYMVLRPYAIDDNGKPLTTTPNMINCLARPNKDMSGVDFRDAMAVMTLVHPKTYILVHEKFGKSTRPARENVPEDKIAGFTYLEGVLEVIVDGQLQYEVYENSEKHTYYPYQVAVINDVNPANLSKGYSPTMAARRWTRIDDYIADYQSGFFENGAVPAGQFVVTAPTAQEYKDIVKNLKKKHKGAGKNNNVTYTYQPIDPNTGKPGQSTITWVPFNTTNKDLSLKEIFEQVNKKIDSVYGVSAFIRAIDEAPNFATAQVIERNFVENTVRPFAIKKWGRFLHEMNRITGGLGYGIDFKLITPHIAEEEKAIAETNQIRVNTINLLTDKGYTLDSSIAALKLPNNWKLLEMGETTTAPIENDQPEVDEGDEAADSPTNKAGGSKGKNPKPSNLTTEDIPGFELRLEEPPRVLMERQVNQAIDSLDPSNATGDATDEDKETFIDEMMVIISAILLYGGVQQWEAGKTLLRDAGIPEADIPSQAYELNENAIKRYRNYLNTIADSYSDDTAQAIRATLERASVEGLSRTQTEAALKDIMNTDAWRIKRVAVSEINRSGGLSSVESMRELSDQTDDVLIEKSMESTSGSPCEFCATRLGEWFPVDKVMVKKGAEIKGIDGGTFVNNWTDNEGFDLHANGQCVPVFRASKV